MSQLVCAEVIALCTWSEDDSTSVITVRIQNRNSGSYCVILIFPAIPCMLLVVVTWGGQCWAVASSTQCAVGMYMCVHAYVHMWLNDCYWACMYVCVCRAADVYMCVCPHVTLYIHFSWRQGLEEGKQWVVCMWWIQGWLDSLTSTSLPSKRTCSCVCSCY